MTESLIGQKIKAWCGKCRGERNCEVRGHHSEGGSDDEGYYSWNKDWYLLVCCGCDHIFAQSVSTNSDDYSEEYDRNGKTLTKSNERVDTWPAKAQRERPAWFDGGSISSELESYQLDGALREVYGALDHGLNSLASVGMRTAFDIAAEMLGVDPEKPFEKKTQDLVDKNFIKESEKKHIDILVKAGNASAHRGWRPSVADIDVLMDTLEEFIFNSMVLPSQRKLAAEKMAKVNAKVPPRKKADKPKDTKN